MSSQVSASILEHIKRKKKTNAAQIQERNYNFDIAKKYGIKAGAQGLNQWALGLSKGGYDDLSILQVSPGKFEAYDGDDCISKHCTLKKDQECKSVSESFSDDLKNMITTFKDAQANNKGKFDPLDLWLVLGVELKVISDLDSDNIYNSLK